MHQKALGLKPGFHSRMGNLIQANCLLSWSGLVVLSLLLWASLSQRGWLSKWRRLIPSPRACGQMHVLFQELQVNSRNFCRTEGRIVKFPRVRKHGLQNMPIQSERASHRCSIRHPSFNLISPFRPIPNQTRQPRSRVFCTSEFDLLSRYQH